MAAGAGHGPRRVDPAVVIDERRARRRYPPVAERGDRPDRRADGARAGHPGHPAAALRQHRRAAVRALRADHRRHEHGRLCRCGRRSEPGCRRCAAGRRAAGPDRQPERRLGIARPGVTDQPRPDTKQRPRARPGVGRLRQRGDRQCAGPWASAHTGGTGDCAGGVAAAGSARPAGAGRRKRAGVPRHPGRLHRRGRRRRLADRPHSRPARRAAGRLRGSPDAGADGPRSEQADDQDR